jgi:hypothetical protein
MCAALSDGASFTPVPGHRHDLPSADQLLRDPQLVLRRDAGVDGHLFRLPEEGVVVHRLDFAAGQNGGVLPPDPQAPGDGRRGDRVVAGDHHDPDPRLAAPVHRLDRLRARRVDHPLQAGEAEAGLRVSVVQLRRPGGGLLPREGEHPEPVRGEMPRRFEDVLLFPLARGAHRDDPLRGAFQEDPVPVPRPVERRHVAPVGLEGDDREQGVPLEFTPPQDAGLPGRDDEGAFRGVAVDPPSPLLFADLGLRAEDADPQQRRQGGFFAGSAGSPSRRTSPTGS